MLRPKAFRVNWIAIVGLFCLVLCATVSAQAPAHYEPTLESLNQHPLPAWYAAPSWAYSFTGGCTRFQDGLRWSIHNTISPPRTTC
jgi:hypothetical protein